MCTSSRLALSVTLRTPACPIILASEYTYWCMGIATPLWGRLRPCSDWKLLLEKSELITKKLFPGGDGSASEGRVLNRTVRFTDQGWDIDADQRHAELLV